MLVAMETQPLLLTVNKKKELNFQFCVLRGKFCLTKLHLKPCQHSKQDFSLSYDEFVCIDVHNNQERHSWDGLRVTHDSVCPVKQRLKPQSVCLNEAPAGRTDEGTRRTWSQSHACSRSPSTRPGWRPRSRCWPAAWGRGCPGCRASWRSSACPTGSGSSSTRGARWSPPGRRRAGRGSGSPVRPASAAPGRPPAGAAAASVSHYFQWGL